VKELGVEVAAGQAEIAAGQALVAMSQAKRRHHSHKPLGGLGSLTSWTSCMFLLIVKGQVHGED
jgi:hypothetical protein